MDRLREWRRACLRLFGEVEGGSLGVSEGAATPSAAEGRDFDVESCEGKGREDDVVGVSGLRVKYEARGDEWDGANGPETDRVRL